MLRVTREDLTLPVYLVEEGRHQEDGGLSQELVNPLPQHRLIEVSVTRKEAHTQKIDKLHLSLALKSGWKYPQINGSLHLDFFIIVLWILFHADYKENVKLKHQTGSMWKNTENKKLIIESLVLTSGTTCELGYSSWPRNMWQSQSSWNEEKRHSLRIWLYLTPSTCVFVLVLI